MENPKEFLASLFRAAVHAADPQYCIKRALPSPPLGRTVVVGAGKGAAQLARALEHLWPTALTGTVVTRYGYAVSCDHIDVLEAAHPVPDLAGLRAAERLLETVQGLTSHDLVIALICGGGSALLPAPPIGFTLNDEIDLNQILLRSGAPISAMNAIRKQFSRIKGGRLAAAAYPARVVSLVVSDIPGDHLSLVASGPTIADDTTASDAIAAIERFDIKVPAKIRDYLQDADEAPRPDDGRFSGHDAQLLASSGLSLEAAADFARGNGIEAIILSDAIEGEAREAGSFHAAIAREVKFKNRPFSKPVVLLSGGETTVTLKGSGKGGRNTEFLLSFARAIAGSAGIYALAADTDGIDGSENNAGAFADGLTMERLAAGGQDIHQFINNNDTWSAFSILDDLFVTGPTGTNVNDFRAILIT